MTNIHQPTSHISPSLSLSLVHIYLFRKQRQARHEASRSSSSVKVTPSRARSPEWRGRVRDRSWPKARRNKIPPSVFSCSLASVN